MISLEPRSDASWLSMHAVLERGYKSEVLGLGSTSKLHGWTLV